MREIKRNKMHQKVITFLYMHLKIIGHLNSIDSPSLILEWKDPHKSLAYPSQDVLISMYISIHILQHIHII